MHTVSYQGKDYTIPFADLLPALDDTQRAELRADIAKRGVVVPILVDEHNAVIDGQHRLTIAAELDLATIPIEVKSGLSDDERRVLCHDLNVHRRQLSPEKRQEAVRNLREQGHSLRQIGEKLGVGRSTVQRDLDSPGVPLGTPEGGVVETLQPSTITGRDGKQYPANQAPRPAPLPAAVWDEPDTDPEAELYRRPDGAVDDAAIPPVSAAPRPVATMPTRPTAIGAQAAHELERDGSHYDLTAEHAIRDIFGQFQTLARHGRERRLSFIEASKAGELLSDNDARSFEQDVRPLIDFFEGAFKARKDIPRIRSAS